MKRMTAFVLAAALSGLAACSGSDEVRLWPEIEPFRTGYLKVSDIHEIYYELCGNEGGKPVFVLHGGPGSSCTPYMRRFFDPDKFLIVLHDQRGAGKSKPYGEIRENTTQHLVADIEELRKYLELEKIILFGGSWGSTLALAYAEAYPNNVGGMVLRGIFLATRDEIDHFYHGGVRYFFPETYDRFLSVLPQRGERRDGKPSIPEQLLDLIQHGDSTARMEYSRAWASYEIKISALNTPDEVVENILEHSNPLAFGLFENYYMANSCFLEEGQLMRDIDKIGDTPVILVNGRYDMICPPVTAYRLHKRLPRSRLVIVENAGHWMGEGPIERELLLAMREFE